MVGSSVVQKRGQLPRSETLLPFTQTYQIVRIEAVNAKEISSPECKIDLNMKAGLYQHYGIHIESYCWVHPAPFAPGGSLAVTFFTGVTRYGQARCCEGSFQSLLGL